MTLTVALIIILILIGVASGVLSGLVGVGGGIIIVPALIYFAQFSQKEAQGTSLGILLLPIGILAVWQYYKQGQIDLRVVAIVSLGFVVGSYFGSKLAVSISDNALKKIFAIMLLVVAAKFLFFDKPSKTTTKENININKSATDKK
ncbi:MAG: sulfite exporter TauE/SafE family protein [Bacteroidetes bacterium]|nr:sulfite exporter TauE/SafE family protein [Bacteroidota bacterium]